ncbi:interferon-induced protein 35 [Megalops cyprinoides]|uniref:interferon-induced protein 35 n=1 Tax=Megalops cyprinoides TaxID=118141 RepID=UPI001865513F|nr:interferon-induced protein 35 [Megalops cyprinoides]XP_036401299.1 interferon-induced protein 35 [Megalops cyprinoides]
MNSEEDFSLVTQNGEVSPISPVSPLEKIRQEITKCKAAFDQLVVEHRELAKAKDEQLDMAEKFRNRSTRLKDQLREEEEEQAQRMDNEKEKMSALQEEGSRLQVEVEKMEQELRRIDTLNHQLKQQTQVSTAVPEKKVVFTGDVAVGAGAGASSFDLKAQIVYPMEGGTALVTFEDGEVAQNIMSMQQHEIQLGDCIIRLRAEPVQFLMPSRIEMDTHICPRRILVSNLPKKVDEQTLMDKLELHFHKKKNGGGEVDSVDMLHDSGNVVIAFMEDNVAKGLTDTEFHEVGIEKKKKHRLRVTPFVNGEITNLQTRVSVSQRTVLLTGIPDIMDPENLQDSLEIHFQKESNGGGEVDAFIYNPLGRSTLALFKEDPPKSQ